MTWLLIPPPKYLWAAQIQEYSALAVPRCLLRPVPLIFPAWTTLPSTINSCQFLLKGPPQISLARIGHAHPILIYFAALGLSCSRPALSCSVWNLAPQLGMEIWALCTGSSGSLSPWTTRKFPSMYLVVCLWPHQVESVVTGNLSTLHAVSSSPGISIVAHSKYISVLSVESMSGWMSQKDQVHTQALPLTCWVVIRYYGCVPSLSFCFLVSKKERTELHGIGLCKEK